jgi:outer membrane protein assembly factor BamB
MGPLRDGSTPEKVAPWKDAPQVLWTKPVGEGYSVPVIAGGRTYVHARVKDKDEEEVLALDAKTGKVLWRDAYARAPYSSPTGAGPRATPAVQAGKLFTFGITGVLTCYQADNGKRLWQVDVYKKFGVNRPRFGICCSPLVVGNQVIVSVGGQGTSLMAFDTDDGQVHWKAHNEPASTSSPILITAAAKEGLTQLQAVFVTPTGVVAVNPADGAIAWNYALADRPLGTSPTPVWAGDLILTSSIKYGTIATRLTVKDGKPVTAEAWHNPDLTAYFATPVLAGKDHLYAVTTTTQPQPESALRCVDVKTGKVLWSKDKIAYYHAGLLRTGDGKLLLLDDSGKLLLLDANPKEYRELARAKVCGPTFAAPALADGRLYVRDDQAVTCLRVGE